MLDTTAALCFRSLRYNAEHQPYPEATTTLERRLLRVSSRPMFGSGLVGTGFFPIGPAARWVDRSG